MVNVLMAVLTAEKTEYIRRLQACKDTWVKDKPENVTLWSVSGPKLGVPDEYDMMSFKIKALCRRALMTPDWQWFLRVDDDVCVYWPSVKPPVEGDYWGPGVPLRPTDKNNYCAGAVTWLSRMAVMSLATRMETGKGIIEDREVGRVLVAEGMMPRDLPVHTLVTKDRPNPITDWDIQQLKNLGYVLEMGSPANMRKLYSLAISGEKVEKEAKNMVSGMIPVIHVPETVPMTTGGPTVFRSHQGMEIVRGPAVFNEPLQEIPVGPAVARPDTDPGWPKR